MALNNTIQDLIGQVVDNIRITSAITAIINAGGGVYNVFTDVKTLAVNDWVEIADTDGFDSDNVKIVTIETGYFTILLTDESITIPSTFGTWKANSPYCDYENFKNEASILTSKNKSLVLKNQKFPLVFLLFTINVTKNKRTGIHNAPTVTLYIIDRTDEKVNLYAKQKNENEFPVLRNIENLLTNELTKNTNIQYFDEYTSEELPYMPNKLNSQVNAIRLQINDLKYMILECNTKNN